MGLSGVRSVGAALGRALPRCIPRRPAWELAPVAIDLLEAAPHLASGTTHLLKPSQHNAESGRHRERSWVRIGFAPFDRAKPTRVIDPFLPTREDIERVAKQLRAFKRQGDLPSATKLASNPDRYIASPPRSSRPPATR